MEEDGVVIIGGKKYKLVPEEHSILDDYKLDKEPVKEEPKEIGTSGYPRAVPEVSQYRERYKNKQIRLADVIAPPRQTKKEHHDTILEGYSYNGENLFYGPGLEEDM